MIELNTVERRELTNPFPGLRSFEIEEAEYFFGREDDIYDLLDRLRRTRFLSVVGASGCGKSSLIKAGLIAALRDGFMVENQAPWRFAVMRPWQNPIRELARALDDEKALDVASRGSQNAAAELELVLRKGSLGIVEALRKWQLPQNNKLLILVDQFEELFAFMDKESVKGAKDEARAFIKLLLEASQQTDFPVYVALTMRSEFLGRCVELPGLPEAINSGLYLLPQMDRDQLRDVIKAPIETFYRREMRADSEDENRPLIAESLVDTMLNELREEDQLPLLQHALMRLWDEWRRSDGEKKWRRSGEQIGLEHYGRIGRLEKALSRHVEEVYEKLDAEKKKTAEIIFRGITDTLDGDNIVRRKRKLREIYKLAPNLAKDTINGVIGKFADARCSFLLLSDKSPFTSGRLAAPYPEDADVDISHESLIRQWELLRKWANDEALVQEIYKQLCRNALLWKRWSRDEKYLYQGKLLIEAYDWYKSNADKLTDLEREFIETSMARYEGELLSKPQKELVDKIIEEGGSRSETIEKGAAYVFFSYAREDSSAVQRVQRKLEHAGDVKVADWKILPSQEYSSQVAESIREADAFVFFISRKSVAAPFCLEELAEAVRSNKRIIPVELERVDEELIPAALRNYARIGFDKKRLDGLVGALANAIGSDLGWARAHARLLVQAAEWNKNDREASLLLSGKSLEDAEQLLGVENPQPPLTPLQLQYIQAGRKYANEEQKKRLKNRSAALAFIAMLSLAAVVLAFWANRQRVYAEEQKVLAEYETKRANEAEKNAVGQKTLAEEQRTLAEQKTAESLKAEEETRRQRDLAESRKLIADREKLNAIKSGEEAQKQKDLAENQRIIAERETVRAVAAEADAKRQAELAREAEADAQRKEAEAVLARQEAERLKTLAEEATRLAEANAELSKARSLSLQAEQLAPPDPNAVIKPEMSVLFATESLRLLKKWGKYSAEANADQALQRGLDALPLITENYRSVKINSHNGPVAAAAFIDGDERIVSGGEDGVLTFSQIGGPTGRLDTQSPISKIHFTEDFLLVQNKDRRIRIITDVPKEVYDAGKLLVLNRSNENTFWRAFDFPAEIGDTAVSRDGNAIAVAYLNTVEIIRRGKGGDFARAVKLPHKKINRPLLSVNFSPNGRYIVTADGDEAWIWDAGTGVMLKHTEGAKDGYVDYAVFSPNGADIATSSRDNRVRIWTFFNGSELLDQPKLKLVTSGLPSAVKIIRFSPNGDFLAIASGGSAAVYPAVGTEPQSQSKSALILGLSDDNNPVTDLNFSADGRFVVIGRADKTVSLWSLADRKRQTLIDNTEGVNSVALSPSGRYVLTAGAKGAARVWSITDGWDVSKPFQQNGSVFALDFSPDSQLLAMAGNDKTIRLHSLKNGELKQSLAAPGETVSSLAFDRAGRLLVSGGADGSVTIWETSTGVSRKLPGQDSSRVYSLSLDAAGKRLAVARLQPGVEIWDLAATEKIAALPAQPEAAFKAVFNPRRSAEIAAAYFDKKLRLWRTGDDSRAPALIREMPFESPLTDFAFSPDGRFLAVALEKEIRIFNAADGAEVTLVKPLEVTGAARTVVAWSPDGRALAVGNGQKAEVWDVAALYQSADRPEARQIVRIAHSSDKNSSITALVFSSDENGGKSRLVTGGTEGAVRLWLWRPEDLIEDACSKVTRNLSDAEWRNARIDDGKAPETCPGK